MTAYNYWPFVSLTIAGFPVIPDGAESITPIEPYEPVWPPLEVNVITPRSQPWPDEPMVTRKARAADLPYWQRLRERDAKRRMRG